MRSAAAIWPLSSPNTTISGALMLAFFCPSVPGVRHLPVTYIHSSSFFFQAEDGIRDDLVTGVQTCALPISPGRRDLARPGKIRRGGKDLQCLVRAREAPVHHQAGLNRYPPVMAGLVTRSREIGRASCRERV